MIVCVLGALLAVQHHQWLSHLQAYDTSTEKLAIFYCAKFCIHLPTFLRFRAVILPE